MPPGFDPWEALVDLEAGLVQVDGRWVCSLGTETFSSVRTNGGLGLLPADRDGAEAVWLAWRARRGYAEPPSSPNVSSLWFTRAAEVINVRPPRPGESSWRAWTWARGPAGLLEPGHVYDDNDPTEAVWNVFASARQVQA